MASSGSGARPSAFRSATDQLLAAAADGANAVAGLLLAPACAACGDVLERPIAGPVCGRCWDAIPLFAPRLGSSCGLSALASVAPYEGVLREILHAWKFEKRRVIGRRLGALAREQCAAVLQGADAAVPVPMTPWRKWRRGFNQADDLARRIGLPVVRPLVRWRPRATQSSLQAAARQRNIVGAIGPAPFASRRVRGRVIVLVDDIVTTGATLEECARVLRAMGARDVRAVTLGWTPLRGKAEAQGGKTKD